MGASDELEYLKSLVSQLNEKIIALEAKAKTPASPSKSPARQLRTVFIGPPGAGMCRSSIIRKKIANVFLILLSYTKAKERKHLEYATNSAFATWQLETCYANRWQRKRLWVWRRRRLWMLEDSSPMILSSV